MHDIQPVSTYPTLNICQGVDVVDRIAYISGHHFAHALDIASPAAPALLWSYSGPTEGWSIQGLGLYTPVADGDAIAPFSLSCSALEVQRAYLPLVMR